MDATKGNIYAILNGNKQFLIPVYQRLYSWEIEQCQRLWKDIVSMQKQHKVGHFVGSIVNIAEQAMPTGVQKYMIIDGQQRMTTLSLLLIALRDYGIKHPEDTTINPTRIDNMLLKNAYEMGDDQYKLLLAETDRDILIALIDRKPLMPNVESRILTNLKFFSDQIEKMEIRLQSRQTGITTWLVSEAIQHAKEHQKSINYLLYPSTALRDGSWERQKRKMIAYGGMERKMFNTKSMVFDNGSAIEFITANFIMPDKRMLGYEKQFIFVDNLECFCSANAGIRNMRGIPFSDSDDMFIGGTDEKDGAFRIVVDYREFCKTHNLNEYLREFDNIHDFIVETDFLKNDVVIASIAKVREDKSLIQNGEEEDPEDTTESVEPDESSITE